MHLSFSTTRAGALIYIAISVLISAIFGFISANSENQFVLYVCIIAGANAMLNVFRLCESILEQRRKQKDFEYFAKVEAGLIEPRVVRIAKFLGRRLGEFKNRK